MGVMAINIKRCFTIFVVLIFIFSGANITLAQTVTNKVQTPITGQTISKKQLKVQKKYIFKGIIKDKSSGKVLPGVTVILGSKSINTDSKGKFEFTNITASSYNLTISANGYTSYTTKVNLNKNVNNQYSISKNTTYDNIYNSIKTATTTMKETLNLQVNDPNTDLYKIMQEVNNNVLIKNGYYAQIITKQTEKNKVKIDFFYSVDFVDENINPKYEIINIASEKDLRVALKRALERCQSKILFNKTNKNLKLSTATFNDIFLGVLEQNEDTSYTYDQISGYYLNADSVEFIYRDGIQNLFKRKIDIIKRAKNVIKKVIDDSKITELEKLQALHDYIVLNTSYDWDTYQKHVAGIETSGDTYMAEGVFYDGVAVCSGYSAAFEIMAKLLGIKIISVTGGNHAWNKALVDGKVSYFDATWDDPDRGDEINYDYFNVGEKEIATDHTWDRNAFADQYLYY